MNRIDQLRARRRRQRSRGELCMPDMNNSTRLSAADHPGGCSEIVATRATAITWLTGLLARVPDVVA
jgi:hypothetical protein